MVKGKAVQSAHWSGVLDHKESSIPIVRLPSALIRFIKFCAVGGSGVVVDMAVLYFLADPKWFGLGITLSKACASEVAMINNFVWNELWTFKQKGRYLFSSTAERAGERGRFRSGIFRRLLLFNAICGIGIGLAMLLLHLFHIWLGWNLYLSNLLAVAMVTAWNFGFIAKLNWQIE